ncbi:MAG: 16S rRNA (cytidine(1402)-2'-O)-methyltransferase [Candidatus Omnitrophota bacterium]|jgi:16S rRNA (cytidine1402-2'-O)-methyltransferase
MEGGKLFIVSTPIGHLSDMTYRAVETLKSVGLIACEDTRHTGILLAHYGINKPLTSYFEHNKHFKSREIAGRLMRGEHVALVSDAGTPGISDPGYRIIHDAISLGIEVVPVPGASAAVTALSVSGLPTDRFVFEGFLPPKTVARKKRLNELAKETRTIIIYESPHRLARALKDIQAVFGDIFMICERELTKKFQEIRRQRVTELMAHFEEIRPQGEFVLLFNLRLQQSALL